MCSFQYKLLLLFTGSCTHSLNNLPYTQTVQRYKHFCLQHKAKKRHEYTTDKHTLMHTCTLAHINTLSSSATPQIMVIPMFELKLRDSTVLMTWHNLSNKQKCFSEFLKIWCFGKSLFASFSSENIFMRIVCFCVFLWFILVCG